MRKTLSVFLISGTMSLVAAGSAIATSMPAMAGAATTHLAVRHSAQTEAHVPPSPSGRQQAIGHGSIPDPTIDGYGGPEDTVFITSGSGYTPGGWVFEGDWTGTAWSGHRYVRADSQGDIGANFFNEPDCGNSLTLYGYDWTTGTFTPPVAGISTNCIP